MDFSLKGDEKQIIPLPEGGRAKEWVLEQRHDAKTKPKKYRQDFLPSKGSWYKYTDLSSEYQLKTLTESVMGSYIAWHWLPITFLDRVFEHGSYDVRRCYLNSLEGLRRLDLKWATWLWQMVSKTYSISKFPCYMPVLGLWTIQILPQFLSMADYLGLHFFKSSRWLSSRYWI